jgi:amino acid adenylation domain-containing protein
MNVEQLLLELRTLDIRLTVEGDRLRCSAPEGRLTKDLERRIQDAKGELLGALGSSPRSAAAIQRRGADKGPLPLSFAQERFWLLQNLDPTSTTYNITATLPLFGPVDMDALRWALQAVVSRHEILRTRFPEERGIPTQLVSEEAFPPLELWDGENLPETDRQSAAEAQIREFSRQRLDLQHGPLLRLKVLRASEEQKSLLLAVHHIVCDAWGIGIFLSELRGFYGQRTGTWPWKAPALPVQYGDYAVWERKQEATEEFRSQLDYWKEKLRDVPHYLNLPTDRPHFPSQPYEGKLQRVHLGPATSKLLKSCIAQAGVTPFMALLTVFHALLHRYTKQKTIVVGTPVSTRTRPELEHLIGCLFNTHALRGDFPEGITTRQLLQQMRTTVLASLSHGDVPFETVLSNVVRERDLARMPLLQAAFIQQNTHGTAEFQVVSGGANFELTLYVWESDGVFEGSIEYDSNLFDAPTIEVMAGCFATLAAGMARDPDAPIDELPLVSEDQEARWFGDRHGVQVAIPEEGVHQWIERQAKKTPDAVAVVCGQRVLTYRDVSERSNRLANRLRAMGVGTESPVALCLERSPEMIVAPLAVWKAGGAYIPIDPQFPSGRVALMLQDSGAAVVVTESALLDRLPSKLPSVICLDREQASLAREKSEMPAQVTTGDSLAYVLYTSGSTGVPKGVEVTHAALTNFLLSMQREPGIGKGDRLLAVTTFSFDIAGLELYLPLVSGAQVVIAPREVTLFGSALAAMIGQAGITMMQATPVTWRMLLQAGWKGGPGLKILCGGEALPRDLAEELLNAGSEVWNLYGPTETTIWSTLDRVTAGGPISIGRPIANTDVYILDERGAPVPPGVVGELNIGGRGLARGYRNREQETRDRFVQSSRYRGARLYRTGDLVRKLADGRIQCLGRADHQVKLRGYRIELGEIEGVLNRQPKVQQAIVVVREDPLGDPRLIAYVTTEGAVAINERALRDALRKVLPAYMIPSAFRQVKKLPLTANRKVDREALPGLEFAPKSLGEDAPRQSARSDPAETDPDRAEGSGESRNHVEGVMVDAWRDILNLNTSPGVFDNFFALGGHSLSAATVVARLREELEMELPLQSIFLEQTIASLASHISYDPVLGGYRYTVEIPQWNCLVPVQPKGTRMPLFFITGYQSPDDTLAFLSPLIPYFGKDQPVFGFRPRWTFGGADYESVGEMAREFLKELRAVQPRGPYLLGGMCVGGIAALELARVLAEEGEQTQLMLLVDTERSGKVPARRAERYFFRLRLLHIRDVLSGIVHATGWERLRRIREVFHRKLGRVYSPEIREEHRFFQAKVHYRQQLYAHCPRRYPGRLTLIVNEEQYKIEPDLGWSGFAEGGLEIRTSPGNHQTMFTEHRKAITETILECIEKATSVEEQNVEAEAVP